MDVQSYRFPYYTFYFFNVLVAVNVFVAKTPLCVVVYRSLRSARPAHVFHRWVTVSSRFLPPTKKKNSNAQIIHLYIVHFISARSLKEIFSLLKHFCSYTPCFFFTDIIKRSGKNPKICQLVNLVFQKIYKRRSHNNMASSFKN